MAAPMAESFGNRQLWQTISGIGSLKPNEYVEYELKKNKEKLAQGFAFYKKPSTPKGEVLKKDRKLKTAQYEFVLRLSELLCLDELQSHDLFCAFLLSEYRGSQKELLSTLTHERHSQALLLKIQDFYNGERLYLLRCVRHILHCWSLEDHVYKDVFDTFLQEQLLEKNNLGDKLIDQLNAVCSAPLPSKQQNGPLMGRAQVNNWALQNLREQVELLELLVVYFKEIEMDTETIIRVLERSKKHSFGWGQCYKHLIDEPMEKLVKRIGYLEVLLILMGLDTFNAFAFKEANKLSDHAILKDPANIEKLESAVSKLGSESIHAPLLLGCSILLYIYADVQQAQEDMEAGDTALSQKTMNKAHRMGNTALQLGVFNVLCDILEAESFCGKSILATMANYCVHNVLSALLCIFQEDTLGNSEVITRIVTRLYTYDFIASSVWDEAGCEGLTVLYNSAQSYFPLDFATFLHFNISLAKAGEASAKQVKKSLHMMKMYTELLDNNRSQDLQTTRERGVFILRRNKHPYQNSDFFIAKNSKGREIRPSGIHQQLARFGPVIRWDTTYNCWHMLMGEIQELLTQVSHGAGMVQTEQILKVSLVMELIKEVMTSDSSSVMEFAEIFGLGYQIIVRFAVLAPAPTELLAHTVQCLALAVPHCYSQISHHLKQTGLLPFLTENIDDFSEILNGDGINQGLFGCILATTECPQGTYHLTLAILDLVTQLVVASSKIDAEQEHIASVLFILREVFPRYQKWRFVDLAHRKAIGQKCLQLYHNIFNFAYLRKKKQQTSQRRGPNVQESCVFGLLFTEAGRALLEIVGTGVDKLQVALAQQPSLMEGSGSDLVALVETSLSLLNRLLLLKPPSLGQSPVEQALSSQPPGRQHQHLVATVAQYIYHRHSHRLPTLATLLLKRLAMVSPMSILACLGSEAEPIRDMFLTRLQAISEDIALKVGILELLAVCVDSQPGLLEIFLSVQQPDLTDSTAKDLKLGRSSCLPILLELMDVSKQCTYECPPDLLCACLDLVHSLWYGLRETPMTVLRSKDSFWPSVLAPLKKKLPSLAQDDDLTVQAFKLQCKLSSFSLRIIAMEVYAMNSPKLNEKFKTALEDTMTGETLKYWSKAIQECVESYGQYSGSQEEILITTGGSFTDHPALNLLLAWKNFLITVTKFKVLDKKISDIERSNIVYALLQAVKAQFGSEALTPVKVKLASVASALCFTLVKIWGKEVLDRQIAQYAASSMTSSPPTCTIKHLCEALKLSLAVSNQLMPSVHIGLLGTVTAILQQCGSKLEDRQGIVYSLLPEVCSVFLQSSYILPSLIEKEELSKDEPMEERDDKKEESLSSYLKLQMVSCCLLMEILQISPDINRSLKQIEQHGIISSILATMESFIRTKRGVSFIYSSLQLLIKIADTELGANTLMLSNLTSHLCLTLTLCYNSDDAFQPKNLINKALTNKSSPVTWHSVYCLSLDLFGRMLRTLGYSFLEDALNVVGVHQDRMQQALDINRVSLSQRAMLEAESTCQFILQLCPYQRQWKFQLPTVMARLMGSLAAMLQTHIALLIRPRYLSHVLEHHKNQNRGGIHSDTVLQTPAYLQQQTSLDDVDQPSSKLVETQCRMLKLVGLGLSCLTHFTPALSQILCDQSIDVTEWEPILDITFGTPPLDDFEGISFGTLLSCVTMCLKHLAKGDSNKSLSPHKNTKAEDATVPKNVVNFVLEMSLYLIMSQACRFLRDPALQARDRQFIKRELGTELNSFLSSLSRQLRRGDRASSLTPPHSAAIGSGTGGLSTPQTAPVSVAVSSGSHTPQLSRSVSVTSFTGAHDPAFFRLVQAFVQKILR